MLTRRAPRARAAVLVVAAALPILAGCRSAPDVAAYVGDEQVTVTELEDAVRDRLTDDGVAGYAEQSGDAEFTRLVLDGLIQREVYSAAAERLDVRIDDDDVTRRIEQLFEEQVDAAYQQLAEQQGLGRADVRELVRQQLLRRELAAREGEADALEESALRERYDEVRPTLAQLEFGYLTVPDQGVADSVLRDLTAAPARYAELAAQFPGPFTLPELDRRAPDEVPPPLADQLQAAAPGTGFTAAIEETGGVVVGFVAETVFPSFEDLRPQLEEEAAGQADAAGDELVAEVRDDLDLRVNPRYGVLEKGRLVEGEGGVVALLEDAAEATEGGAAD
ncbi:SurA N-terminal domain-containing protein [Blastococcus sp. LR1]|uniref:SurA N-terminal domain-containing protein n=1 Tax=Blastococcus sp. LR1 TaxID=2877000 RepID=UPI001CC9E26D|nr:SurA N-terminal domain-containing protein [Blastococcus sp. LR1]MCA0144551.1 SurA N-terminal domain-containing protein [Blastococcus sp. LR1]